MKYVRQYTFDLIPKHLFEQVDGAELDMECLAEFGAGVASSPLTLLYVAVDDDSKIHGFFWGTISLLTRTIFINHLSFDKEYQNGRVIEETVEFIKELTKDSKLRKKIYCGTTHPKAFEKHGFKRTDYVSMFIELENENG